MKECFYSKLITWKDPNLSAAFLTGGNVLVFLLLVSGNALAAWIQFVVVFGLIPLGFVARLAGFDKQLSELARPGTPHEKARSYYESHFHSQLTGFGILKIGVYLIVSAKLVSKLGIPLMIGLVGNACMLTPLLWEKHGLTLMTSFQKLPVNKVVKWIETASNSGIDAIAAFGPMAPAITGGVMVFFAVIIASKLAASTALLVANMKFIGYLMVLTCAFAPAEIIEKTVLSISPSPATVERFSKAAHADEWIKRATELVLWENYQASLSAFLFLYLFYYISSFVGIALPIALGAAAFVSFTLTPSVLKEKALAEVDKMVKQVKEGVIPSRPATPEEVPIIEKPLDIPEHPLDITQPITQPITEQPLDITT